jgi:hypothetical protein
MSALWSWQISMKWPSSADVSAHLVAERHERGQVMEAQGEGPVAGQEAPVELDLAADRLDRLDEQAAARTHGYAGLPLGRLVPAQECRGVGGHLHDLLHAEGLTVYTASGLQGVATLPRWCGAPSQ